MSLFSLYGAVIVKTPTAATSVEPIANMCINLAPTANKIITVKNLVKNYGNFQAVKGISFDVYEGEIFGLLGPNGAGKSTTLEIIETLRQKTSGEVIVDF